VFVGGLSFDAEENDVREFFNDCGTIKTIRIPLRDDGKKKGMAFVEFSTGEEAQKAEGKNGQEMMGRWLKVQISSAEPKTPRRDGTPSTKEPGCRTVFVGNLSFNSTEEDLSAAFAECGAITSVRIATDKETGKPRGFGHVEFEDEASTDKAVALAGTDVGGRAIRVDYAGTKQGGGGGDRGGFRGRGRGGDRGGGFRGRGGDRGGGFRGRGGDRGGGFRGRGGDRGGGFRGRGGDRGGRGGFNKNSGAMHEGQGKKVKLDD